MTCCGDKCSCGSACRCGNGSGGCKMYPSLSNSVEASTTQVTNVDVVAPNKGGVEGAELKSGGESGNGCSCNPCKCDPCNC